MEQARVTMTDLFAEVLIGMPLDHYADSFNPGPVRTFPRIHIVRAEILCRRRSKRIRAGLRMPGKSCSAPSQPS